MQANAVKLACSLELAKFLMWLLWSLWLCFQFCYWNSQLLINGNYAKRINMNCSVLWDWLCCSQLHVFPASKLCSLPKGYSDSVHSPLVCPVGLTLLHPVLYCQALKLHGCSWRWIAWIQSVQFSIILFRAWRYIWEARRQFKKAQCCSFLDLVPCKRLLIIKEALCSSFSKLIPCKRLFTIKESLCSSFLQLIVCNRLYNQRSSVLQFLGAHSMHEIVYN